MKTSGKYIDLWRSKSEKIAEALRNPEFGKSIQLSKTEFDAVGNRKSYSFNIVLKNGVVQKPLGGSAVARDLVAVIENSAVLRELLKDSHFKISMGSTFKLSIQKVEHFNGF